MTVAADEDAENELRTEVLEFMDTVRAVERAIAATRRDTDAPSSSTSPRPGRGQRRRVAAAWPAPAGEPLELTLVPEVVSGDDDLLDDLETVLVGAEDEEFEVPELAVEDGDLLDDQPNSVEPQ